MKIQAKSNELNNWCKANNLKRDYSRELISEQIVKNNTKGFTSYTGTSYNTSKAYKITNNAIENIPHLNIEELTAEQNNLLEIARKQVLTSAQKEKVGVECANDVIAFSKRPYMLGIESISNNGKHLSALLKTERCTIENALQYQTYINQYLDDCKHKFGDFSKLSFEKLSEITENVLKEANNYGYKYYTKQK